MSCRTCGSSAALGRNDSSISDLAVVDDLVYGEPNVPEPTLLATAAYTLRRQQ